VGDRLGGPHEHETAGSVAPAVPTLPFKFNGAGTPPHLSPSGGVFFGAPGVEWNVARRQATKTWHIPAMSFRHACKLGLKGIVGKRVGSCYVSGRSRDWLKFKNPAAPNVKREAEEDWGKERWR